MLVYYYAITDENDVLCVDQVGDGGYPLTEEGVADLAPRHPGAIYFYVEVK